MKRPQAKKQKTQQGQDVHSKKEKNEMQPVTGVTEDDSVAKEERRKAKDLKRKEKRKAKTEKEAKKKEKQKQAKALKKGLTSGGPADDEDDAEDSEEEAENDAESDDEDEAQQDEEEAVPDEAVENDMEALDMSGFIEEPLEQARASTSRSASPAPEFSPHHNDRSSSTSSIPAPPEIEELRGTVTANSMPPPQKKQKSAPEAKQKSALEKEPSTGENHESPEEAAARKAAQIARIKELIEAKRAARNADGLNGKPAKSRSELMEARRILEQKKKEKKKEVRAAEREELKKKEFEDHLASLRGSPSLGSELFAPRSRSASVSSPGVNANNFSFGRVAFADGTRINSSLSGLAEQTKKPKGALDAKTALIVAEKKQAHLNSLDEEKRKEVEEKDIWLNARKRVNGEKIKDDVSLLKKSLKRREKSKNKSEREWTERKEGVAKGQEIKQKKREHNIAKRKDEKGVKGKKKGKTGAGAKKSFKPKSKGTPGFR